MDIFGLRTSTLGILHYTKLHNYIRAQMSSNEQIDFHLLCIREVAAHSPPLKQPSEAVVILLHVAMKHFGFRCVGTTESSRDESGIFDGIDQFTPEDWNKSNDCYVFTYKHTKSSMNFVIKSLVMGENLLINGTALEDKKVHTLEIDLQDYTRKNADLNDYNAIYKDAGQLLRLFKTNVIDKMLPGIHKEGFETSTPATTNPPSRGNVHSGETRRDPLRDYSAEDRRNRMGPQLPYAPLGHGDLYPDMGGFNVPPVPGGFGGMPFGGGSIMGPDHPLFRDPYNSDPYSDPLRLPRRPPPGARFDPYGPPMRNHFGDPNPDDLPPPGFGGNMYL
ncbi:hypothetical protein PROFUN_16396 [Planoprotostelium fungivorum]|uniref:Uncharacterized protein n=1 Tax=Planoprotostelium fungivorum TaxID=1890364 RepID=A0A2P6MQD4_9EUKA|nr:hypothetical protein PROFUN_16516 [Planoprotostelium fungivorum]PRP74107.1 hypothetical protein PROFUN_16396 [Planoprotostelium fungivorum]